MENVVFVGTDEGLFRLKADDWEIQTVDRPKIGNITRRKKDSILAMVTSGEYLYVLSGKRGLMESNSDSSNYRYVVKSRFRSDWMSGNLSLFRVYDKGNSYEHISPNRDSTKQTVEERDSSRTTTAAALKHGNVWIKEMDKTVKFAANENRILVMQSSQDFFSNDAGDTWRTLKKTMEISTDAVMLDDKTFFRCGSYGIQRSTDGGKSWHQFNTGLVNSNIQQIIANDGILYANTHSQLVYSSDGGETWLPISQINEQLPRIAHTNGTFYARKNISGNPMLFTLSKDYKLDEIPNIPNLMKRNDISNKELNIVTIWTDIYRKMLPDGGFAATDSAYFIAHKRRLYRWNIGSLNWYDTGITTRNFVKEKDIILSEFGTVSIEFAVSGKRVYVGKSNGRLIQSNDEGTIWTNITDHLPFKVERYKHLLFSEDTVYIATDKGVIRSNNGTDWQVLTDSEGTAIRMNKLTIDGTKVFGAFEQKIYQLNANNERWIQITPEIGYYVNCLDVDGNMLYVGTNGRGVLRYTLDD